MAPIYCQLLIGCLLYKSDKLYACKKNIKCFLDNSALSHSFKFLYRILNKFSVLQLKKLVVSKSVRSTISINSRHYSGNISWVLRVVNWLTEKYINLKNSPSMHFCPLWIIRSTITWFTFYCQSVGPITSRWSRHQHWPRTGIILVSYWSRVGGVVHAMMNVTRNRTWRGRPSCDCELRMSFILVYIYFRPIHFLNRLGLYSLACRGNRKNIAQNRRQKLAYQQRTQQKCFQISLYRPAGSKLRRSKTAVATWPVIVHFLVTLHDTYVCHMTSSALWVLAQYVWSSMLKSSLVFAFHVAAMLYGIHLISRFCHVCTLFLEW
jgi:hypothetical protein